jgi:hypothetical protein
MNSHVTAITPHDLVRCTTARRSTNGDCGTRLEVSCSCGFRQGASCMDHAEVIASGHRLHPNDVVIPWHKEANAITDVQLHALFAKHCECRPLDLTRTEDDHAAIHDCDTAILHDIQIALGIVRFDDIGRTQAMREARARCVAIMRETRHK